MNWLKPTVAFVPVSVAGFFYLQRLHLISLLSLYGALSVGRVFFQVYTSRKVRRTTYKMGKSYLASIILPVYNEDPKIFEKALISLIRQNYPNKEIIVIDDGSPNHVEIAMVCDKHNVRYVYQENAGKREAMYYGFSLMHPDSKYVLTADSDTVWKRGAARELINALETDNTGAVTGYVAVTNAHDNLLTRMIDQRYWMAFNQERASQGYFGAVVCVSGPLGAYRRDLIDQIKEDFINQRFLGKSCTFGDDRHLTNLVLIKGYQVRYAPKAVALTQAPTSFREYLTQQTRWGKSHWREMLWQFMALPKQHIYLSFDWIITLLLPFLLAASIAHYLYLSLIGEWHYLILLTLTIIGMSVIRIAEPLYYKRWDYLLFVGYTVLHIFVMLPLKFYALATVNLNNWGTRVDRTTIKTIEAEETELANHTA